MPDSFVLLSNRYELSGNGESTPAEIVSSFPSTSLISRKEFATIVRVSSAAGSRGFKVLGSKSDGGPVRRSLSSDSTIGSFHADDCLTTGDGELGDEGSGDSAIFDPRAEEVRVSEIVVDTEDLVRGDLEVSFLEKDPVISEAARPCFTFVFTERLVPGSCEGKEDVDALCRFALGSILSAKEDIQYAFYGFCAIIKEGSLGYK